VPLLAAGLAVALLAAVLLAVSAGSVALPVGRVWAVLLAHLTGGAPPALDEQIVWRIRTPRVLLAALVGASLSTAGAALQALVRNPLADPYVLGISSGSALGAVLVIAAGGAITGTAPGVSGGAAALGVSGGAFVGAAVTTTLVFLLARRSGQLTGSRLVLAGVAVGYLATAATSLVQLSVDPASLRGMLFWLMGSVAGAGWPTLGGPAAVMLGATGWLLLRARLLNALSFGDDDAIALGVPVARLRTELLLVSSLLTATTVAAAGTVGFVGLMVPHAVRMVTGPDHRRLLPLSALTGALFVVLVDLATRTVHPPDEFPITVFTAALGAPFFLWLLRRQRGG
jgi:iron complex transport system permease protein